MAEQALIALMAVSPFPVVANLFGSHSFKGVFIILVIFKCIFAGNNFATLMTFQVFLSTMAGWFMSL
jgi:hypothetical protein